MVLKNILLFHFGVKCEDLLCQVALAGFCDCPHALKYVNDFYIFNSIVIFSKEGNNIKPKYVVYILIKKRNYISYISYIRAPSEQ